MSIHKKSVIIFISLVFVSAAMFFILIYTLTDNRLNNSRAEIASRQLSVLEELNSSIIHQTKSIADFLLGVEDADEIAADTARIEHLFEDWGKLIEEELKIVSDYFNKEKEEEVKEKDIYIKLVTQYSDFVGIINTIINLQISGDYKKAKKLYTETISGSGMYQIISTVQLTASIEDELLEVTSVFGKNEVKYRNLVIHSYFIIGSVIFIILLIYFFVRRIILKPLRKLENAAVLYQTGDKVISINISSRDEIGSLAAALNGMMKKINRDTIQLDYASKRIGGILNVVSLIIAANYDVACSISDEGDIFDRLSIGINSMINDLLKGTSNIKEQHDWLNITLGSINEGLIALNISSEITYMNRFAERITGRKMNDALGQSIKQVFNILKPDHQTVLENKIESILLNAPGSDVVLKQTILINDTGLKIPVKLHWAAITDSSGNIKGALLIFRDISTLLKKYQEVDILQKQMIQKEKLSSIGLLTAGIAHEINNPIGYIQSNFRTLHIYIKKLKQGINILRSPIEEEKRSAELKKLEFESVLEDLGNIMTENDSGIIKIAEIVNSMQTFSRQGDESLYEVSNLNHLVQETLTITANETKYEADIELDLQEISPVKCIPNQINQVLLNLILNASQAVKTAQKEENSSSKGKIFISTFEDSDFVCCRVSDDGCGIPEKALGKIFDPFYTTKEPGEGTGLGLNVSYNIMKKHNGDLQAANNKEIGSRFTLRLPKHG